MKTFGVVLTIIGLITAIISYNMDVSIPIVYGESIKDTGLAFDRQNYIIGSLLVAFFGVLIVIFDSRKRK
ncbi:MULTISPECIES: hypothetical protein [Providencia]|uniref:Uncharacterized protein n=2 Tax=Providencia TaxID=586 RepID=A0AA42FHG5_9GAMM|nr:MULTISPECIES: hypothetical protein [Providencia]APC11792.1 hypothetical protein RB151_021200 [Providencia rettgeri]AVL75125.1 hypothetical protein CEQ08_16010 [Providencia rettgeri]EIL1985207.1 hypothetical protein [Providencia rettgeri]EIU7555116.1 hypothetical protein [Providencia rettgeri]EIU9517602.1 hypothetical protein [Providencia rettgeri]